jgi:hypothetical protein
MGKIGFQNKDLRLILTLNLNVSIPSNELN